MRPARLLLGVAGLAMAAYGGLLLARLDLADLLSVVLWLAGGVLVHDAVIAPLTVAGTLLLGRLLPAAWRTTTTVALVVLLTVTATAVPVLVSPDDPGLLDREYVSGWLLLAGAVLLVAVLAQVAASRRDRTTR